MDSIDLAVIDIKRERKRKYNDELRINAKKREAWLKSDSEAAAHPLVKDARFLKTSFFPAALPECFANME